MGDPVPVTQVTEWVWGTPGYWLASSILPCDIMWPVCASGAATAPRDPKMTKRDADSPTDDGIVSEDVTQLMEHIELTGERRIRAGLEWEMATPVDDLEDAPILIDDESNEIPNLEAIEVGEDIELFTETEIDLNRRLLQVEDEQLELAAGIGEERARWQRRVASLRADMIKRNHLLAEREQEIEDLSARLAVMAVERDRFVDGLRELQRSIGQADVHEEQQVQSHADNVIAALHERLRERSQALLVAHEEIDRLRAERAQLVASIAGRDELFQRLHARLRELEGHEKGDEQKTEVPTTVAADMAPVAEAMIPETAAVEASPEIAIEMPRHEVLVEDLQQALPQIGAAIAARNEQRVRRYLIGLDMVGSVYEITLPRINIGRTRDNDLRIVDPTVSRLHAVLKVRGQEITVIDANSRNGIFVNGIQLRYAKLEDGDTLTFGAVRFRYRVGSGTSGGEYGPD